MTNFQWDPVAYLKLRPVKALNKLRELALASDGRIDFTGDGRKIITIEQILAELNTRSIKNRSEKIGMLKVVQLR